MEFVDFLVEMYGKNNILKYVGCINYRGLNNLCFEGGNDFLNFYCLSAPSK